MDKKYHRIDKNQNYQNWTGVTVTSPKRHKTGENHSCHKELPAFYEFSCIKHFIHGQHVDDGKKNGQKLSRRK
jgi:hypothetical protein